MNEALLAFVGKCSEWTENVAGPVPTTLPRRRWKQGRGPRRPSTGRHPAAHRRWS
ncbi:hypothetical protein [Nonomuraea dietziae]|uniref:hypothetical protein n=1 Tax=Nonomuraea dietziae TaxID=65515 RepID=UPI0031D3CF6D